MEKRHACRPARHTMCRMGLLSPLPLTRDPSLACLAVPSTGREAVMASSLPPGPSRRKDRVTQRCSRRAIRSCVTLASGCIDEDAPTARFSRASVCALSPDRREDLREPRPSGISPKPRRGRASSGVRSARPSRRAILAVRDGRAVRYPGNSTGKRLAFGSKFVRVRAGTGTQATPGRYGISPANRSSVHVLPPGSMFMFIPCLPRRAGTARS